MRNGIYSSSCQFLLLFGLFLSFFCMGQQLWVTASTVAGVVFSAIAWLFLLNAWLKGLSKYLKNKAVFNISVF
jgi:multisubunit Na+/H+ antiporter MnhE subunit